jgi:hypothetical protein
MVFSRLQWRARLAVAAAAVAAASLAVAPAAGASARAASATSLQPGNLLVSGADYDVNPDIVPGVTVLPPGCTSHCVTATAGGAYPQVFNNVLADPAFGVTEPIVLDQMTPSGTLVSSLPVPAGSAVDHAVTSFSSKSELALNLSTDGSAVTFMGYVAAPGSIDISNTNTPAVIDPTDPVPGTAYRAVVQLNASGAFAFTETNAYSGENGRAAILNAGDGQPVYYTAGDAGDGKTPQPDGVILGTGAQIMTPSSLPESAQNPGQPTPVGSFSVTQLGDSADPAGKDSQFNGLAVYDNVLYFTKASGASNGVNTVYFLDTTGKACPKGTGLPQPGAALPVSPIAYDASKLQADGVTPDNMCILQGFPTKKKSSTSFPVGMFFANKDTLYVADQGNGDNTYSTSKASYTKAAKQTTAGLQKWIFNGKEWKLAYTLTQGLNLGAPYTVTGYPSGDNAATGLPWAPATDGLRNIAGQVSSDGTVTIYAVTSTVSGGGDQGADPNKLVAITDALAATSLPAAERFQVISSAGLGQVLRGVTFTPGTGIYPSARPMSRRTRA